MKKFLSSLKNDFLDLLYPNNIVCNGCGCELDGKAVNGFCARCFTALPFNDGKVCFRCGSPLENLANYCNRCQSGKADFDAARSSFIYQGEIVNLIYGFKFGGKRYIAENLASFMAVTLRAAWSGYDLVIPVPLHEKRLKSRGFNQAEDLARELCKITKEENLLRTDLLIKTIDTAEQARLSRVSRAENLEDSFAVTNKAALRGKIVLLIDDVLTTGATAHECAKTLKRGGAEIVCVLTLASTKHKSQFEVAQEGV